MWGPVYYLDIRKEGNISLTDFEGSGVPICSQKRTPNLAGETVKSRD
jgi:hypothetical protein